MKIFQVDAFTNKIFGGNPAAVCPLEYWLETDIMQKIAMENNLSETAFFVKEGSSYFIRWFTPELEIDLCGHATLASAHVIFNHLDINEHIIHFKYGGGNLTVTKHHDLLSMDFPSIESKVTKLDERIIDALGHKPVEVYRARDLMVVYDAESEIGALDPDFTKMMNLDVLGVIVTSPGDTVDFVSRFFAPRAGIYEDPVTGSAHCMLIPYWAKRLKKNELNAFQISKRLGTLSCEYRGDRVSIAGRAVTFMVGELQL